ncbi:hypothetical protein GJ744_003389 [Endocarpon pusillum]|uniref:Uncharacterized protein n=1 Tax=Endocarpon pusillum TaxID=364733 RepID=A0A8H7AEC4_9EURO|nr:hypothetical protein GJ744_003389 [Endocarpon pusillum]
MKEGYKVRLDSRKHRLFHMMWRHSRSMPDSVFSSRITKEPPSALNLVEQGPQEGQGSRALCIIDVVA